MDLRNFNRVFFCRYDLFDDNKVNLRNIYWALISWDYLLDSHIMNLRKFDWELMSVSFRYLDLLDFCWSFFNWRRKNNVFNNWLYDFLNDYWLRNSNDWFYDNWSLNSNRLLNNNRSSFNHCRSFNNRGCEYWSLLENNRLLYYNWSSLNDSWGGSLNNCCCRSENWSWSFNCNWCRSFNNRWAWDDLSRSFNDCWSGLGLSESYWRLGNSNWICEYSIWSCSYHWLSREGLWLSLNWVSKAYGGVSWDFSYKQGHIST